MRRFVSDEVYKANRHKIRFGTRCIEMLMDGAVDAFAQAAETHRLLEKIYVSAMDFDRFGEMSDAWTHTLFKEE